MLNNKNIICL